MQPKKYVNNSNIPLSIAAWLANDDYDYDDDPNVISVSSLIKPIRQFVLGSRVKTDPNSLPIDIISLVKSRMGQSIHTAIEATWVNNPKLPTVLKALGLPSKIINKIKVNPSLDEIEEDDILVYLEQRVKKPIGGKIVSGKYDMCFDGQLADNKSTGVYTYIKETKVEDYILQGSIYRWLSPNIVTKDTIQINYIFTDWKAGDLYQNNYPPAPQVSVEYPLMSLAETERWILKRLDQIAKATSLPEIDIPFCTDTELWRGNDVWKYYKKSQAEAKKSTKNFDDELAAKKYYSEQGYAGELVKVPGEVKACTYCPGYELCSQKNQLIIAGDLKAAR